MLSPMRSCPFGEEWFSHSRLYRVMKRVAYGFREERYFHLRLYALHDCRITPNMDEPDFSLHFVLSRTRARQEVFVFSLHSFTRMPQVVVAQRVRGEGFLLLCSRWC